MKKANLQLWLAAVLMLLPALAHAQMENQGGNGVDDPAQVWNLFSGEDGYGMRMFSLGVPNFEEDYVDWQDVDNRIEIWNVDADNSTITLFNTDSGNWVYDFVIDEAGNMVLIGESCMQTTSDGAVDAPCADRVLDIVTFYADRPEVVLTDGKLFYWLRIATYQEWDKMLSE